MVRPHLLQTQISLAHLAGQQHGHFSRAQAHAAGFDDHSLAARVGNGTLVGVGPNAFRFASFPHTLPGCLLGLVLDVGGEVWVAGPSAAAEWGFDGFRLRAPFHLLLPAHRNVRRNSAVIHRSEHTETVDLAQRGRLPITTPERTVIDLARTCSPAQLRAAIDSGIRDRVLSEDRLHRRIVALRSRGRFGIPALVGVIEAREMARGDSWLEREFLRLLTSVGVPLPRTQRVVGEANGRSIRVDCRFPGTRIVVELLGYAWHRTVAQMNRDTERMNAMLAAGLLPFQFTTDQVVNEPHQVLATLRAALTQAA